MHFMIRTVALGVVAALGLGMSSARAADLDEIAAFALNICDAVNATGITISSADHCMKFSGEFTYEKHFAWYGGGSFESDGYTSLDLLIEVMGDSDFGVTRGWIDLEFCLDTFNCYEVLGVQTENQLVIDEIGISIGNTTVLATGTGATIFNKDDDETLNHLLSVELDDYYGSVTANTGGVYVSLTHDLGNGWSVAKAVECIDSCFDTSVPSLVGVVSYDNEGITGHLSVAFGTYGGGSWGFDALHAGFQAELSAATIQGAFFFNEGGHWEANASIKATLDIVELAGGFMVAATGNWVAIFSAQVEAGDFTIAKAFRFSEAGYWWFESEVSTDLSDTLSLAVGFEVEAAGDWELSKTLTWTPGGGYELEASLALTDDGYILADSTVTLEF